MKNTKKNKILLPLLAGLVIMLSACVGVFGDSILPGSSDDPVVSKSYVDSMSRFTPIEVKAGKSVIGGEGSEMILRSGEASAIGNGENGVSDVTEGKDLLDGYWVFQNHLLLVPRADGRGIKATTDIWVMVKGVYTVQ
ncbi:MAG: hypothetical protein K6F52_06595 [Clostridia bacterium]|nr:hypothetical protein [Clostridia bacterium]